MPLRSRSAGDSSDPHATTTVGARTVKLPWTFPSASMCTPSTPVAWPFSASTRCTRLRTYSSAPFSNASRSQVRSPEFFAPDWSPKPRWPALSGEYFSGSALRMIVLKLQPSSSAASFIRCCGPFRSLHLSVAPIRPSTASRWRS